MEHLGITASYINVVFKKDGNEVYKVQGSLGCIRQGEPKDSHDLIRQAYVQLQGNVNAGKVSKHALDFTSVVVGNSAQREFSRAELITAGIVSGRTCGTKTPPKKHPKPKF